jgi:hypothetical protein
MKAGGRINANIAGKDLLGNMIAVVMSGTIAFCVLCHLHPLDA